MGNFALDDCDCDGAGDRCYLVSVKAGVSRPRSARRFAVR